MAISSEQSITTHPVAALPFDAAGRMPPWRPTAAFWLRRLSIALALALIALVYFITPTLMRDGPSRQVLASATVANYCAPASGGQAGSAGASLCTLVVHFIQSDSSHIARLQRSTPFPDTISAALITYHERSLLGISLFGHLVVTRIATPTGQTLLNTGAQVLVDTQTQLPPNLPQAVALALLLAALLTFFYPWPVWKVRVNAEVVSMRRIEVRNRDHLPVQRHLARLRWQTSIFMEQEVSIPGRLYRRLRPGDHAILIYEHLRSGAFKALRAHLPRSRQGWLEPGTIQIGALTPWRWRWLFIAFLWLEIPVSLLLLSTIS
jgi:hypothetical protein